MEETQVNGSSVPGSEVPMPLMTDAARVPALEAALVRANETARQASIRANQAERDLEAFRRKVAERAMQEKEERGWCSELDEILEDLGLGEFVTRDMAIDISFTVTIENCPPDGPTQDQVDDAATAFIRQHLSSDHWSIAED